jgi:LPXTG-motif cell wall-anchored protein
MPNGEVKVDVLPETGGLMLLPVAAILLLASSGLLMLIALRRQHG